MTTTELVRNLPIYKYSSNDSDNIYDYAAYTIFPDEVHKNIVSYCIDDGTFKGKKDTKGRPLNIIIKNVNLRYHNYGCVFKVEDDIAKSDKFKLLSAGSVFL